MSGKVKDRHFVSHSVSFLCFVSFPIPGFITSHSTKTTVYFKHFLFSLQKKWAEQRAWQRVGSSGHAFVLWFPIPRPSTMAMGVGWVGGVGGGGGGGGIAVTPL